MSLVNCGRSFDKILPISDNHLILRYFGLSIALGLIQRFESYTTIRKEVAIAGIEAMTNGLFQQRQIVSE